METLEDLRNHNDEDNPFLELLSCEGGCINGPGRNFHSSAALSKARSARFTKERIARHKSTNYSYDEFVDFLVDKGYKVLDEEISERGFKIETTTLAKYSEQQIFQALAELGKHDISDELNCMAVVATSCRDMAIAYLEGWLNRRVCY